MNKLLQFVDGLVMAGITVRFLPGYEEPYRDGYVWREDNDLPVGHMHHHTATPAYTPNREKANAWAGLSINGSHRLYQEDYGDGLYTPVYVITNLYPAPISSGAGDITVTERVRDGIEIVGRQGVDTPGFYGNTHWWNTEWVLDGIGAHIDEKVWDMMVTVCDVQNEVMGWSPFNHIGHGHHTQRKIDLRDGRYIDFDATILALRGAMSERTPHGMPYAQFKRFVEALFRARPDEFHGDPSYFYRPMSEGGIYDDDNNVDWDNFWDAAVRAMTPTN